jgi:hypothetical protein
LKPSFPIEGVIMKSWVSHVNWVFFSVSLVLCEDPLNDWLSFLNNVSGSLDRQFYYLNAALNQWLPCGTWTFLGMLLCLIHLFLRYTISWLIKFQNVRRNITDLAPDLIFSVFLYLLKKQSSSVSVDIYWIYTLLCLPTLIRIHGSSRNQK